MRYFEFFMGLIIVSMCLFLTVGDVLVLARSRCVVGTICGIDHGTVYAPGATVYYIVVQLKEDGKDIELVTLNSFALLPFFTKVRLSRLRKKHVEKRVHVYYNPDHKKQVLIREYIWKEFLWCAFLFSVGGILMMAGIFNWN